MFERLKYLFKNGIINETHLDKAINKGWITTGQKQEIVEV